MSLARILTRVVPIPTDSFAFISLGKSTNSGACTFSPYRLGVSAYSSSFEGMLFLSAAAIASVKRRATPVSRHSNAPL